MVITPRAAVALLVLSQACGRSEDAAPPPPASATPRAAGATPACPRTGHWSECAVLARLEQSGVAPRKGGTIAELPPVGVPPLLYMIGTNALAVYLFPDTATRARAARALDTLHFIPPSASLTMRGEATVIQNDNLLGLLYSRIDQQRERVSDGLMAGAPQP